MHSAARNGVSAATARRRKLSLRGEQRAAREGGYLRAGEGAGGERRPVIVSASARTSPVSRTEEAWAYCAAWRSVYAAALFGISTWIGLRVS